MLLQTTLTGLIVASCSLYALWTLLLPAGARRRLARSLLHWPLPALLKHRLRQWTQKPDATGCASCDKSTPKLAAQPPRPLHVVRRKPR